jgi:hypothetical protein
MGADLDTREKNLLGPESDPGRSTHSLVVIPAKCYVESKFQAFLRMKRLYILGVVPVKVCGTKNR